MSNAGKNLSDVRFYSLSESRQAIGEPHDKDQTIYNVLLENFRGANSLPKNKLTQITVGELQESPTKIDEIFELMHKKISPISSEKGLASIIPFETTKRTRRLALEERLAQAAIICDRVKYKQKYGYYESGDGIVKHPYFFEVFVGHSNQCAISNLKVMQSINSKISNNTLVFGGPYEYETDTSIRPRSSIFGIFEDYKYSHDKEKCKKRNSIVIVNLISPRIDYKSHGKSRINHIPFAKDIANTIVAACKGGDDKDGKKDQIVGLREVLKERKAEYLAIQDPIERKKHEWTQSDVYYATRKLLINVYGYTDQEINRDYLTGAIREECANLGVTREQIGIIAADRAQLYFNRKWTNVGLDEIEVQVDNGTDMTIIEKEGVIMQISLFSDGKRIALLNTRGFLVEYASKLAKLANEKGCNISIIVDWDVSGLLIYLKIKKIVPSVKRIGVDFKTLEDLGLSREDVEEKYEATENKHFDALKRELIEAIERAEIDGLEEDIAEFTYLQDQLSYLEEKRIEINSITAQLKDNAKFWNWIENQLRFYFPDRDFTRSSNIPEYAEPDDLKELNDIVKAKGTAALKRQREELLDKLANNNIENAFLFDRTNEVRPDYNYDNYDTAIAEQSKKIIENNDEVKPYLEKIRELLEQLR